MNQKEKMPLGLSENERTYISKEEFINGVINSIADKYPNLRQDSKAP